MPLKPNSSAGVNTGSRLLIFFMISFKLLGYSTFLSICLGAIAGLAGGFTAAWWNASEDFLTDEEEAKLEGEQEPEAPPSAASSTRRPRYGFGVRPARQARRERAFFWPGFGRVFRRKR
jgi:hypothetical protein